MPRTTKTPKRWKRSESARELGAFLEENTISYAKAGEALHVSGAAVCEWVSGRKTPTPEHRHDVHVWTGGRSREDGWGVDDARPPVRPFVASGPDESGAHASAVADKTG